MTDFWPSIRTGLETQITQCVRITVNYRCHFKCNFCYVVPMHQHRTQELGVTEVLLSEAEWRSFMHEYFAFYVPKHRELPGFAVSICASDPARDPEACEMLLRVILEEAEAIGFSRREVYGVFPITVINDIHRNGSVERLLALIDRLRSSWNGILWYASTLQTKDGHPDPGELELHRSLRHEVWKRQTPWYSILTPTLSLTRQVPTWHEIVEKTSTDLHQLISSNNQSQMMVNVIEPIGDNILENLDSFRKLFLAMFEASSRYWIAAYSKTFFSRDVDDQLLHGLAVSEPFPKQTGIYYVVNEVGVIPGFGANNMQLAPHKFGCWPITGCYLGILGIEPGGILSACQFGHDPIASKASEICDRGGWEKVIIRSPERLKNLRDKLAYPFVAKTDTSCAKMVNGSCRKADCGAFVRGSCPADLYYHKKPFTEPSASCETLSTSCDILRQACRAAGLRLEDLAADAYYRSALSTQHFVRSLYIKN